MNTLNKKILQLWKKLLPNGLLLFLLSAPLSPLHLPPPCSRFIAALPPSPSILTPVPSFSSSLDPSNGLPFPCLPPPSPLPSPSSLPLPLSTTERDAFALLAPLEKFCEILLHPSSSSEIKVEAISILDYVFSSDNAISFGFR
jgi:hypothetical protein